VATPVTMPQLGESVTEGTITRWLKAEGDEVALDEPLAEVDTDKVNAELPSPFAGKVERLLVSEGTTVDVGAEIALVAVTEEPSQPVEVAAGEGVADEAIAEEFPTAEAQPAVKGEEGRHHTLTEARAPQSGGDGMGDGRGNGRASESAESLRLTRSSPVVRRLAAEHGVDIREIPGSGIGGRVTKKDIEGYVGRRTDAPAALHEEREAFGPPVPETGRVLAHDGDRALELTPMRRAIASRMSLSKREAPHAWTMVEVDVSGLVSLRSREKEIFAEREAVKLTYLPFIVRAVVESLKENPVLNSVWDGDRVVLRKQINIGIAVDLDDALIVPVIKDADGLNIVGLARRMDALVKRARSKQLGPDDVSGGTFTVNNPGALGSVVSTPIINHPQAAILSAEAVVKRPVVVGDTGSEAIAIRSMMNLEVSFDHRILDGGAALRFLNAVKRRLEGYGPESGID